MGTEEPLRLVLGAPSGSRKLAWLEQPSRRIEGEERPVSNSSGKSFSFPLRELRRRFSCQIRAHSLVLRIFVTCWHHDIEVKVLDADIEGLRVNEIVERILHWNPDLVGFSLMTPQLITTLRVSSALKKARPGLPIVLGGAHIDSTYEDTFSMSDRFDFADYGEGKFAMLEVPACSRFRSTN